MNIELLEDKISKIESVFNNIMYMKPEDRVVSPTVNALSDLTGIINEIFDENKCTDILYAYNTDKPFFAIRVSPAMTGADALTIIATEERVKFEKYKVEFDSKLFNIGLDATELAAILLYEISAVVGSNEIIDLLRTKIDSTLVDEDDVISIRDSANYSQLIIFAIKDTLYKISNFLFKETPEELFTPTIQAAGLEESIVSAKEKIAASATGISDSLLSPTPIILDWMLMVYRDIKGNKGMVYDTLVDAKSFTASRIEIAELQSCIDALNRIDTTASLYESNLDAFFTRKNMSALNEISIFKALKKGGLRSLENELYEYSMRVKNCTDAQDAYLIMRGINSRLGILEDYLYNEDLSPNDRKHWEGVADSYRQLRYVLSKKKFEDKQYGLFFDYSALDKLDKKPEE